MHYQGVRIGHKAGHTAFTVDDKITKIFNWRRLQEGRDLLEYQGINKIY